MNTKPHTHFCPKCRHEMDCESARDGGCIFLTTADMTCNPCAIKATAPILN